MKSWFYILLMCTFFQAKAEIMDTISVTNGEKFLTSIQSHRTILIKCDTIVLNPDEELILTDIHHLQIIGPQSKPTLFITSNTSADVIQFKNCSHISLQNLSMGHYPESAYCSGDVISAYKSDSMFIHRCDLFGSGVYGISLSLSNFWCSHSTIRECSEDIINVDYSRSSLVFSDCSFYLNSTNEMNYPAPWFKVCNFFTHDSIPIVKNHSGYYPKTPDTINSYLNASLPAWNPDAHEEGQFESICQNTFSATTTSTLSSQGKNKYFANNLLIANREAWVEGKTDHGIGERVILTITDVVADYENWQLSGEFDIINGYAKDTITWLSNSRVKQFKVIRNGQAIAFINLLDTPNLQKFDLGKLIYKNEWAIGETLELEITEVYQGTRYKDTAITFIGAHCSP